MFMEKLQELIGLVPLGSEDVVYVVGCLFLLYMLDCFCGLLKIAFRGLK